MYFSISHRDTTHKMTKTIEEMEIEWESKGQFSNKQRGKSILRVGEHGHIVWERVRQCHHTCQRGKCLFRNKLQKNSGNEHWK